MQFDMNINLLKTSIYCGQNGEENVEDNNNEILQMGAMEQKVSEEQCFVNNIFNEDTLNVFNLQGTVLSLKKYRNEE